MPTVVSPWIVPGFRPVEPCRSPMFAGRVVVFYFMSDAQTEMRLRRWELHIEDEEQIFTLFNRKTIQQTD